MKLGTRLARALGLFASTLALFTVSKPALAQTCPTIVYLGNHPENEELPWSENVQGVAHDPGHWFFTQQDSLLKLPVEDDIREDPDFDPPTEHVRRVPIPAALEDLGVNHFGDVDEFGGFLFTIFEKQSDPRKIFIAALERSDLSLVSFVEVTDVQGDHGGWVAIDPVTRLLYSSDQHVSSTEPITRYALDLDLFRNTRDLSQSLAFYDHFFLTEGDGSPLARPLRHMQGATFSPWRDLFIINGFIDEVIINGFPADGASADRGGIHLFTPEGRLIVESTNGSGDFNFEYHTFDDEEPEGIDWWNRDVPPVSPFIQGQLHGVMIDNTQLLNFETHPDDLYFKHYTVDYWCKAGLDSDGDGLSDDQEAYQYNTHPLLVDTDGDGRSDGQEVNDHTDPLTPDPDVTPPEITCSADLTAEFVHPGVPIPFTAIAMDDIDPAPTISCSPVSGSTFAYGSTTVSCLASDDAGNESSCTFTVTLEDTTPPSITCPAPLTVECSAAGGAPRGPETDAFLAGASATDAGDPNPAITNDAPSLFPVGVTTVTFTATDFAGRSASCQSTVEVADTASPSILSLFALSPTRLFPPNHKLVNVSVPTIVSKDTCDPAPHLRCSVTSDEPADAAGDGATRFDIVFNGASIFTQGTGERVIATSNGVGSFTLQLRAERAGPGDGRVYGVVCLPVDAAGNRGSSETAVVVVPR